MENTAITLWDDSEIVRDDSQYHKGRVYKYRGHEYPSVTNLLKKIKQEDFSWWERKVGKENAKKIRDDAARHGTAVHLAIEAYLKCDRSINTATQYFLRHCEGVWLEEHPEVLRSPDVALLNYQKLIKPFSRFLPLVEAIGIEIPVCWASECGSIGFGGTSDAFLRVDTSSLKKLCGTPLAGNTIAVADWKNFRKPKAPIAHKWNGDAYYPLIGYAMQLSAYCAAFNQLTDRAHKLNQALLVCAHPESIYANIYYLSPKAICWHWQNFKEAMWCLKRGECFDWIAYQALSEEQGYLGEELEIISARNNY